MKKNCTICTLVCVIIISLFFIAATVYDNQTNDSCGEGYDEFGDHYYTTAWCEDEHRNVIGCDDPACSVEVTCNTNTETGEVEEIRIPHTYTKTYKNYTITWCEDYRGNLIECGAPASMTNVLLHPNGTFTLFSGGKWTERGRVTNTGNDTCCGSNYTYWNIQIHGRDVIVWGAT